ncbi:EAL domain-containing protein [Sulfurospirillum oryzae]|uniref:EAL domain-containing protein n=1 Tax=Sulfurospirillum oryzae TaxID=2976535 RepID=UPI0021E8B50B|nr:GGDEF domain-containing phosphodiesterase [Sulfurospirillum oryzae]
MIDALTKVHSHNAFEEKLLTCKSPKLFLVDIKQFKNINLEHGDEGGNFVLCAFSMTLTCFAKAHEMELFRIKDDKFALLLDTPFELSKMERITCALCDTLQRLSYAYQNQNIDVEVHIGISFDHFEPLEKAQKALLVAKAENQPFVTYSEFANILMSENEEAIEAMMKSAIESGQIVLHFQTIVDRNEQPFYAEALLRLAYHQTLQSPKLFLKIAKERNLYEPLFESIVKSVADLSTQKGLRLALNLSSEDLINQARVDFLKRSFAGKNIVLEIQYEESTPLESLSSAMSELKKEGMLIALDNVDNINLITYFPDGLIDVVKVRGDIIRNLALDASTLLTCKTILKLCRHKKIQTVATQLNAKAIVEAARELDFDLFQGYIFEQPHTLA